jgi:nucleoside phosphorylase
MVAARVMLDKDHGVIRGIGQDHNTYYAGRIHDHNVIIAVLPAGIDGHVSAAGVVKDMIRTFGELRFILLVGIGGGIPHLEGKIDIRLGDVVVSKPCETNGGVIQYDRGKCIQGGSFERKGILGPPPNVLLTALTQLQVEHEINGSLQMSTYLTETIQRNPGLKDKGYCSPPLQNDRLFVATYRHLDGGRDCSACPTAEEIEREARVDTAPQIHYGIIASGEQVVKDPSVRDHLRKSYGALCVEMEAAGVLHIVPCLVIRGICDYADSHKNNDWHNYAAMTAAAYAKELLTYVSSGDVASVQPLQETLSELYYPRMLEMPPSPT